MKYLCFFFGILLSVYASLPTLYADDWDSGDTQSGSESPYYNYGDAPENPPTPGISSEDVVANSSESAPRTSPVFDTPLGSENMNFGSEESPLNSAPNTSSGNVSKEKNEAYQKLLLQTNQKQPTLWKKNQNILNKDPYTPWERFHRDVILRGFVWTGSIAPFINDRLYMGTPFFQNTSSSNSVKETHNLQVRAYRACIEAEMQKSFGPQPDKIEPSDIKELKAIAKHCARDSYGKYFLGKEYTTREEFLMLFSTAFGSGSTIAGYFDSQGSYVVEGAIPPSIPYTNLSDLVWYGPFLHEATPDIFDISDTLWEQAVEIQEKEIVLLCKAFLKKEGVASQKDGSFIYKKGASPGYTFSFPNSTSIHLSQQ